jgi:putative DNA primase/helicase
VPTAKFWLATNHQPPVSDDSPGFWRRIRLIPFRQQFGEDRADKDLKQKLRAELPGILRWAIEGCLLWQRDGLGIPEVVRTASQAYRQNNDQLGEFLAEDCEVSPEAIVPAAHLWARYCLWAEGNGERPLDRRGFSARLETKGFRKQRFGHDRCWFWVGVGFKK